MSVESDLFNAILEYVKVYPECTISVSPNRRNSSAQEIETSPDEDEFVEFV